MESLAKTLKLLGHPDRLRILALLRRGELTVSELVSVLQLSQPRVTQYIRSLEESGIIERLREGSWVFSRITTTNTPVSSLVRNILDQIPDGDPVLAEDFARLRTVREARARKAESFFADVANNRGQLSHEFLPQSQVERAILEALGNRSFDCIVDLGTGTGRILVLLAEHVKRGIGIDLSPDMLRVARHMLIEDRFSHLSVQQSNLSETPLKSACADLVTLHQVLHHLDQPGDALAEAERLLAPGGTLLIVDFAKHDRDEFRERYAHRRLGFADEEIGDAISTFGFSSVSSRTVPSQQEALPDLLIWTAERVRQSETETV